jgi:hypothetical protein
LSLQFREQAPGPRNVPLLRGFIATTQQDNHDLPAWREVEAVTGAGKYPHLMKPATKTLAITQIAETY